MMPTMKVVMFNKKLLGALVLLLCSVPAFAGLKGLDGLDVVIYIIYGGAAAGICTLTSWILVFANGTRKRRGLVVASILFSLPLLILSCYCLFTIVPVGFICSVLLLITWWLIYRSAYPEKR